VNNPQIIVIGGGAAGFFGAIAAARAHRQAQITLLEAGPEPLAKVRISGGGRCNVTHHCFDPAQLVTHYPRGGKALRGAFTRFQPHNTVDWFQDRGVRLKTEADGRMFPVTDDSATIVDCLQREARQLGVTLRVKAAVSGVSPNGIWVHRDVAIGGDLAVRSPAPSHGQQPPRPPHCRQSGPHHPAARAFTLHL
jgi:predicted Rossmann fold flavoprotein